MQQHNRAALEGWLDWEVIEKDGKVSNSGHQHNLILDRGLDAVAVVGLEGLALFAVVGTGNAAPDVTQTALGGELARSSAVPSTATIGRTFVSPGVYDLRFVKEFGFTEANGNLAEWGFSHGSDTSFGVNIRELFRDSGGVAIVLTKTAEQKLRLNYRLRVTLAPVVPAAFSFNITGVGEVSGVKGIRRQGSYYSAGSYSTEDSHDLLVFNDLCLGRANWAVLVQDLRARYSYGMAGERFQDPLYSGDVITPTAAPYVVGSYARPLSLTLSTDAANVSIWGFQAMSSNNYGYGGPNGVPGGLGLLFDAPIVKDSLHTLTLTGLGVSWGRAP